MAEIAVEVKAAVRRLEELRADGVLTAAHVRTVACSAGASERTVWRWLSPSAARPARQPRTPSPQVRHGPEERRPQAAPCSPPVVLGSGCEACGAAV
ncbi:hypothetical protein [Streptomyces sp. S.PNR 29]|uniref:hypothetical protein n=1 Tax=Streptomyces sp. S.PNR 29 TaxID=2973805 RepID=UPI0025B189A1|nr:hypothetical protein [Streptomyces sp. S.PNR 29]MDN0198141.1 hypothetical protein [Streptomyces sp. S.PNR 29]